MRTERKYHVLTLMSLLLSLLLLGIGAREPYRMKAAVQQQHDEYVLNGARLYSTNCVQCHGPRGAGSVGPALNRTDLKLNFQSSAGKAVYESLGQATTQGVEGNLDQPMWRRSPDGRWLSYTGMPGWGQAYGGPFDEDAVKAVTLFIMQSSGDQWSLVGAPDVAAFDDPDFVTDEAGVLPLPDAPTLDANTNAAAKSLLNDRTRSQCLNCHTIGAKGARIGPDLTRVGAWGVDQEFLEWFIAYANQAMPTDEDRYVVPHDQRMPVYWYRNRASTGPAINLSDPVLSEGPYYMLRFRQRLTPEEIRLLAQYLMGLQ